MEDTPVNTRFMTAEGDFGPHGPEYKEFIMLTDDEVMNEKKYYLLGDQKLNWIRASLFADLLLFTFIATILCVLIFRKKAVRRWFGLGESTDKPVPINADVEKATAATDT